MITNQKDLRRAFWESVEDYPTITNKRLRNGDYPTDTRIAWCDFIERIRRESVISEKMAQRATLEA